MYTNPIDAVMPHERTSSRYSFISSKTFVDDMASNGWHLTKTLGRSKTGLGKHLMRFRNEAYKLPSGDFVEVLCLNAHDGTSSFRLTLGIYRLVCSNGLVVGTDLVQTARIRHVGYTASKVQAALKQVLSYNQALQASIARLQATQASEAFKLAIVKKACEVRKVSLVDIQSALRAVRLAVTENTQWNVLNRVQEHFVNGGLVGVNADNERYTVRRITGAVPTLEFNQALFNAATTEAA